MSIFDVHPGPYILRKVGTHFNLADANGDYVCSIDATDANAVLILAELNSKFRDG